MHNVAKGGVVGQVARSEFLMSRKRLKNVKMLKTNFEEEITDDPFANIVKNQTLIDPNLRLEKGMSAKEKWKVGR